MKNKLIMLAMLGIFSANFMHSDEVEEVIVQASLLDVTEDEIGDPLHILSGSDVSDLGTVSLGEVLDSLGWCYICRLWISSWSANNQRAKWL